MHIEVEEFGIAQSAAAAEAAASVLATIDVRSVAAMVALAMPGSRAGGEAAAAASAFADAAQILSAVIAQHAEALRAAVGSYVGTEDRVLAESRRGRCTVTAPTL